MVASHISTTNDSRVGRVARRLSGFLLLLFVLALSGPITGSAQVAAGTGDISQSFFSASRRWNVPVEVLMAVGYVESHWEQRAGEPSIDNGYGIMHVTDRADGTMERVVSLTGLPGESIRRFAQANIEAGAALLSDISRKANKSDAERPNIVTWYSAVAQYSGATDTAVRDAYAQEVFQVIRQGARAQTTSGETVVLAPSQLDGIPAPLRSAPNSDDYGPALWVPAYAANYTVGRPYPPLNTIVIHDTEGSYGSAISWFQNPNSGVSAHYVIRSSDGQITQMVRDANTAYHAGNWDYNVRAIGIEHEGYASQPGWYTEAMYQTSSTLVRHLTERYGIKKDRAHIIGHYQIPNQSHTDPGPRWDWTYYMSLVRRDGERAALVDNTDAGFVAVPAQIDPAHYWWTYSGGYGNSNTYATTSVTNQANSVNSATWTGRLNTTGYYDVYAFVPYVDNSTPDTVSAKYKVYASDGIKTAVVSQKAITDVGTGSWANLGKYYFTGGTDARIGLDDWAGETGKNVWFDAVMWIPAQGAPPPPPPPATATPPPVPPTVTRTAVPANTPTPGPTWTPGPCNMRFTDLPDTHWAYSYVAYLYCRGIVSGYADGTYRPNEGSSRGQFSKLLVLGLSWVPYSPFYPSFSDVQPGSTFYTYVEAALLHGAISGYPDGTFRPGDPVTRGQVAKMLVIGKGWPLVSPSSPTFSDVLPGSTFYSYIETAFAHGIVNGFADGTYQPGQAVSRAQLAKMVALAAQAARGGEGANPLPTPASSSPSPVVSVQPKETISLHK
ncbi:MAG: S-layer homology domain-containing protein [Chloroflexota bacterium]